MKNDLVTPQIREIINESINNVFFTIGPILFLLLLVSLVVLYHFLIPKIIQRSLKKYEDKLEKNRIKNIEVWKQQKEIMFQFVDFLEDGLFNNQNINQSEEQKTFFKELNKLYGKSYLVMETDILDKINECISRSTSNVQKYYLYREFRKQLMSILYEEFDNKDCPYISGDPQKALICEKENIKTKAKNLKDLKENYPFIEESEKEHGKYKTLPFFGNR